MKANKIQLTKEFEVSRLIHGHWRLGEWNMTGQELLKFIEQTMELGITSFDHADIYGEYTCEKIFGDALRLKKELRREMQLITKCGVQLNIPKFPERKVKFYEYSFEHIMASVENSLKNFGTDYIDLLLLHRPAPFFNPEEVAKAFSQLKKEGKVLHFGVSNFTPRQYEMLNTYTDERLVTNQVEISPYCLEHFENGNIDFFLKEGIKPMAWSPMAGGRMLNPTDEKGRRVLRVLSEIAEELEADRADKIVYSWILQHPSSILPIVGSGKIERIRRAVEAGTIPMSPEQWYRIYIASTGEELP